MRAVIQRVSRASVDVDNETIGSIERGFLVLLGVADEDTEEDMAYLVKKITQMRIFEDEAGKMNLSLKDVDGEAPDYFPIHTVCQHEERQPSELYRSRCS